MSQGRPKVFKGVGASPGVAIGRVFLLDRGTVRIARYHVAPHDVDQELLRLEEAIKASVAQLESIRGRFVGGGMDHMSILEAHEMMLRDRSIIDEAQSLIKQDLLNAEWAVSRVLGRLRGLFDQISDAYLKERKGDIDFVGERILRNLSGQHADVSELENLGDDAVIVARDLSPVDTALITRHKVSAFVTELGGRTSHTSIIARSLEVPAVVGASGIFEMAGSGDTIVVDGLDGTVMLRPSRAQLERGRRRAEHFHRLTLELLEAKALPARTEDGHTLGVMGNIELPSEVATVLARGGEGIGLYRTEYMFLGRRDVPTEEEHYRTYRQIFEHMGERSVTVRTLDLGGDKIMGPIHTEPEPNPALGLRAIRFCLKNRSIFEAQIAGLLRAAIHGNLKIMLPMISSLDEYLEVKAIIHSVARRLTDARVPHQADVPLGIMVEVPSAALCAAQLAEHVAFFSIGTNDLLQYLLAIDRANDQVSYLYRPLHPAVIACLKMVVDAAHNKGLTVSVCGEIAGDIEYTPVLLALGIDVLSMNSSAIPRIKRLVREVSQADCQKLLAQMHTMPLAAEAEALVRRFVSRKAAFMGPAYL